MVGLLKQLTPRKNFADPLLSVPEKQAPRRRRMDCSNSRENARQDPSPPHRPGSQFASELTSLLGALRRQRLQLAMTL